MALVEAITCGNTEIPAQDLRIAVRKLAEVNPKTKMSGLASEYQVGIARIPRSPSPLQTKMAIVWSRELHEKIWN